MWGMYGIERQIDEPRLRAIPLDCRPQLPCCCNTETRCVTAIGDHEQRHETGVNPEAIRVRALEIGPPANPLGGRQSLPAVANGAAELRDRVRADVRMISERLRPLCHGGIVHAQVACRATVHPLQSGQRPSHLLDW